MRISLCTRLTVQRFANKAKESACAPEFRVHVLSVPLQMFPHADGLLDEVVQVLRDGRRQAVGLEDAQDLVAGH